MVLKIPGVPNLLFNQSRTEEIGLGNQKRGETTFWSCGGSNFAGGASGDSYTLDRNYQPTSNQNVYASVELHQGAVITGVIVYGNAAAQVRQWTLRRLRLTSGVSNDDIAFGTVGTEDTSITDGIVNNETFAYYLEIVSMVNGDSIRGARITYQF